MLPFFFLSVYCLRLLQYVNSRRKQVCVIGCGPSGMSMLLQLGKLSDEELPDIVCYEKQDTVGGCGMLRGEQVHELLKS